MPLSPIPPDPKPTVEELQPYLDKIGNLPTLIRNGFARMHWEADKQREDPNAFLVAYATGVKDFAGYASYSAYLRSYKWTKKIRARVLVASGHRCRACPNTAQEVHHRDYRPRVLEGDDDAALVALCISCHDRIEDVRKRQSWNAADRLLCELVQQHESRTVRR